VQTSSLVFNSWQLAWDATGTISCRAIWFLANFQTQQCHLRVPRIKDFSVTAMSTPGDHWLQSFPGMIWCSMSKRGEWFTVLPPPESCSHSLRTLEEFAVKITMITKLWMLIERADVSSWSLD
jgi:hypothetical protein